MSNSRYYNAPHLYEMAFSLPPQSYWRRRSFNAVLGELESLLPNGGNLLDVGCGAGVLAKMIALKHPAACIEAVDLSSDMIEYARRAHPHPSVRYEVRSFWQEEGEYDVVTAAYCWHFFPLEKAASKLKSVLRTGGSAVIVATRVTAFTKIHRYLFSLLAREGLRLHEPADLAGSLSRAGLSVEWKALDKIEGSYVVVARKT